MTLDDIGALLFVVEKRRMVRMHMGAQEETKLASTLTVLQRELKLENRMFGM